MTTDQTDSTILLEEQKVDGKLNNADYTKIMDPQMMMPFSIDNVQIPEFFVMKTVKDAREIIRKSKEPFWGKLIGRLYREGYTVDQMREAFERENLSFKWNGQIHIWYQDSNPTAIEQLQFALGQGNPEYVNKVIQTLLDKHCSSNDEE